MDLTGRFVTELPGCCRHTGACAFVHRPQFISGYSIRLTGENMSAVETQGLGMVPMVIEQSGRGERSYDIYSRLL